MQASLTGHLVLATLHTNDAPSAVTRLTDMGIEPSVVSLLLGVFGQRLVRKLCVHRKRQDDQGKLAPGGLPGVRHERLQGAKTGVYELMVADDRSCGFDPRRGG